MSTLGVVALVLAALVVAAVALVVWVVLRHRATDPEAGSPRTVADLVRLRAERAQDVQPVPVPVERQVEDEVADTGVADADVADTEVPAAEPEVAPVAMVPEPVAVPVPQPPVALHPAALPAVTGSDTPWNRAARMTECDGVVWAPEPDGTEPDGTGSADAGSGGTARGWSGWSDADDGRSAPAEPVSVEDIRRPSPAEPSPAEPAVAEQTVAGPVVVDPAPTEPVAVAPPTPAPATPEPVPAVAAEAPPAARVSAVPPIPLAAQIPVEAPIPTEAPMPVRRTPAETEAEQAAADLALLRTFGCAPAGEAEDDAATVSLAPRGPLSLAPVAGADQPVAFRVVGRDGGGIGGAGVTLLDDRGQEAAEAVADADGRGEIKAPHPGRFMLVSAAPGHQPGAVAITVADEPVEADLLLARSASVAGTVFGEDGPIVGAHLTLVQDGEIVDTTDSGPAGDYRLADLAAGEYGLSVTAAECEPAAVVLNVPGETDLCHDVDLDPAGLPSVASTDETADDVMIGRA